MMDSEGSGKLGEAFDATPARPGSQEIPRNKSLPDMHSFKGLLSSPVGRKGSLASMESIDEDRPAHLRSPRRTHTFDSHVDAGNVIDLYRSLDDHEDPRSLQGASPAHTDTASTDPGSLTTVQRDQALDRNDPAHFDRYGFRKQNSYISEEDYDAWWEQYSPYCVKRKRKWEAYLCKCGLPLNDDSPLKFPSSCEKLKRYVRKGIPAEWRGAAWWYFARGDEMLAKNKGVYDKLLLRISQQDSKRQSKNNDFEIIERDLGRTFPDNIHFHRESFQREDPVMIQALRRVLMAFTVYDPSIGYCQSMNFIAGLLLLFMDEEKAFWMLVIITKKYLPGVHSLNLEGVNIDQGVLILCIREYLPELWEQVELSYVRGNQQDSLLNPGNTRTTIQNYFSKEEYLYKLPPITLTTASWFMSCFIGSVPIETTLRIWDCLFYEKSHFLFKTSLAILKLCEDELLGGAGSAPRRFLMNTLTYATQGSSDSLAQASSNRPKEYQNNQDDYDILMFQVIQTFPRKLLDPNTLFDRVLFKKKVALNQLTQDEVDLRRKYVTIQRNKLKHFDETVIESAKTLKHDVSTGNLNRYSREYNMSNDLVNETVSSEVSNFNSGGLSSINWNNSIKARVRRMRPAE